MRSPCSIKCFSVYLNCRRYFTGKCLAFTVAVHTHTHTHTSAAHGAVVHRKVACARKGGGEKANCRGNVLHHSNEPITTFLHPIKSLAPFTTSMTLRRQHTSSFSSMTVCFSLYLHVFSSFMLFLITPLLLIRSTFSPFLLI